MRAYHKINPAIWRDEKVRAFADDGQLAWIFMLTAPQLTALGVLPATIEGLAAERRWSVRRFRKAIAPAIAHGMLEIDEAAGYIGFRNWLKHNEPEGPNVVTGPWLKALDEIPECPAKRQLIARCRAYLEQKAPTWKDGMKSLKPEVWDAFTVKPSPHPSWEPSPHPSTDVSPLPKPQPEPQPQPELLPHSPLKGARATDPPGFSRFWERYPRKKHPHAALKAWGKQGCEAIADTVLAGLEVQREHLERELEREGGRFVPHPATWLNAGGWKDEPPTNGHDPRRVNAAWEREVTAGEAGT